jgi:hypothetical protein
MLLLAVQLWRPAGYERVLVSLPSDWVGCDLTVSWYLNSSSRPNVGCDKHCRFFALRDIKCGEEVTVDYRTYNESC